MSAAEKSYKVQSDYAATYVGDGRIEPIRFSKGDTVTLAPDVAEWVNRDAPGTLAPASPPRNRQAKSKTRAGDGDD